MCPRICVQHLLASSYILRLYTKQMCSVNHMIIYKYCAWAQHHCRIRKRLFFQLPAVCWRCSSKQVYTWMKKKSRTPANPHAIKRAHAKKSRVSVAAVVVVVVTKCKDKTVFFYI